MRSTLVFRAVAATVIAALSGAFVWSQSESAPDPIAAYPENYTVLVDNEHVRVLDFRLRKGAKENFHGHPANVAVFLGEFRIRFTFPGGRTGIRDAKLGDVGYSDAVIHASENIGETDAHGILIELKNAASAEAR